MECPSPGARYVAVNHGAETAFFQDRAHVHVNQEQPDGDQRDAHVNKDGRIAQKPQAPWKQFGLPQEESGKQQEDHAVKNSPEEKLLSEIEASDGREFVVFILNV